MSIAPSDLKVSPMTHSRRSSPLPLRLLLVSVLASMPLLSQEPTFCTDCPGFATGGLHFTPPGAVTVFMGAEYQPGYINPVAGVKGDLWRLPTLGLRLGLSENAEVRITWQAYNSLRVRSQPAMPVFDTLGNSTTDYGDVLLETLVKIRDEVPGGLAYGFKIGLKLPNTNERKGIGVNTTDVFASLLLAKTFSPRFVMYGDFGLGILSEPTKIYTQNDVLTYGLMTDYLFAENWHFVTELNGRHASHKGFGGTESRGQARAGFEVNRGRFSYNLLLVQPLTSIDGSGIGVAFNMSFRIGFLRSTKAWAAR